LALFQHLPALFSQSEVGWCHTANMYLVFLIPGLTLAALAAVFHYYVFYLESFAWTAPRTRQAFGIESEEIAKIISPMAFNQGFYNAFLAIEISIGLFLLSARSTIGYTCIYAGLLSIVGAGLVLRLSSKRNKRAAFIQLLPALTSLIFITVGLSVK
jgi:putative membrane protein